MKEIIAQFKNLNPRDPGAWPAAPKGLALLVLFAVLLGAGFVLDLQGQLDALDAGKEQETKLKEDYKNKIRFIQARSARKPSGFLR